MRTFWECEEGFTTTNYSMEETKCEEHYQKTVKRMEDGRYSVGLPKSNEVLARLGESKEIAHRRLMLLDRRLALRKEYHAFMADYLDRGHMRKIDEHSTEVPVSYYIPHHPVIKDSSTTTRVRVVFDASSKSSTGISLNDVLLNGPVIQDELRTIIMRGRFYRIMLVADVEKMFRQIWTDHIDVPLQNILFRFSVEDPVQMYELLTVTYGTKPAPFLATRTLKQLSMDEINTFPLAARRMSKDVYMDDVITGANDVAEARKIRMELDEMLLKSGFRLPKWVSNSEEALEGVDESNLAIPREKGIDFDQEQTVKTLGLIWEPKTDTFRFKIQFSSLEKPEMTKRKVLSNIARLFDPLGMIGPVVTSAKIIMQQIWQLKDNNGNPVGWDDVLPESLLETWLKFYSQLPKLDELRIPRYVILDNTIKLQLHYFCDASDKAYGVCAYARSLDACGQITVCLISSKSRVAPLKRQSAARLELCGARLAVELHEKCSRLSFAVLSETSFDRGDAVASSSGKRPRQESANAQSASKKLLSNNRYAILENCDEPEIKKKEKLPPFFGLRENIEYYIEQGLKSTMHMCTEGIMLMVVLRGLPDMEITALSDALKKNSLKPSQVFKMNRHGASRKYRDQLYLVHLE
ncbi:uncharacterized protein LOC135714967 [Ochlerotatus camptorhynchus]|uniref:uncharacterized protein LOC135714967 n=1 Tax=Ochlerotatus camptorhynchus TaxID=644619 RepID=UPI0031D75E27